MLDLKDIDLYAKKFKINQSVVYREFIQLVFLKEFYSQNWSEGIFFKGGTAIRLVFDGSRFSEDLDFTVMLNSEDFEIQINKFWKYLEKTYGWTIKIRKTMVDKSYLLTVIKENKSYSLFINLDFSFREKVLSPDQSVIKTEYPVIFTSFIHHLSKEEVLAEKIRAIMTREKGRDIYDLWYLLNIGTEMNEIYILEKLKYYKIAKFSKNDLLSRISNFSKSDFVLDLKPFVPINQRDRLSEFYDFVVEFIKQRLK